MFDYFQLFVTQVWGVFRDVCRFWQIFNKLPKLKRSTSDVQSGFDCVISPDSISYYFDGFLRSNEKRRSFLVLGGTCTKRSPDESDEQEDTASTSSDSKNTIETPFRERASTDGTIFSRPKRWQYPPPGSLQPKRVERRMSISLRGSNASY